MNTMMVIGKKTTIMGKAPIKGLFQNGELVKLKEKEVKLNN